MPKPNQTFEAYVMFCGAEEVPDQSRLTRAGCLYMIAETCENYEVDLILHITSESALKGFKVEDVTEELFDIASGRVTNDEAPDDLYKGYKGKLGELVDEYIEQHEDTQRGRYIDRKIEEMRGKND